MGWLPFSMAHSEIASGAMISLAQRLGTKQLKIAMYGEAGNPATDALLDIWSVGRH